MKTFKMIYAVTSMVTLLASTSAISAPSISLHENIQIKPNIVLPPLRVPVLQQISPSLLPVLANKLTLATKDYKTFHGSTCQPYYGSQQGDIDHRDNGLYNKGSGSRIIVCPIVRDNVNKTAGVWTDIFVNNPANSNFRCWVDSRGKFGNVIEWRNRATNQQGNQTLHIDIYDMVQDGNFNLYCSVPKNGRIASFKTGEILRTDSNN